MSKLSEPALAEVLFGILDSVDRKNVEAYLQLQSEPAVARAVECLHTGDVDGFRMALSYKLDSFVDGMLLALAPHSDEARFLFKHADFVECLVRERIERVEGFACCSDKTRWLLRRLAGFFLRGERIEFDRTQKYTFHLPQAVLNSHDDVVEFFNALRLLYCGRPQAYLALMSAAHA